MREPVYLISDALHIDKLKKIYYNIFIKNIKKGLAKMKKLTDFQIIILFLLIGTPLLTIFLILVYMCGIGVSW